MEVKKILKDIKSVNEILDFTHKSVTIFGSARFDGRNRYCKDARKNIYLSNLFIPRGTIITPYIHTIESNKK